MKEDYGWRHPLNVWDPINDTPTSIFLTATGINLDANERISLDVRAYLPANSVADSAACTVLANAHADASSTDEITRANVNAEFADNVCSYIFYKETSNNNVNFSTPPSVSAADLTATGFNTFSGIVSTTVVAGESNSTSIN